MVDGDSEASAHEDVGMNKQRDRHDEGNGDEDEGEDGGHGDQVGRNAG
jgi:hypothetical protein